MERLYIITSRHDTLWRVEKARTRTSGKVAFPSTNPAAYPELTEIEQLTVDLVVDAYQSFTHACLGLMAVVDDPKTLSEDTKRLLRISVGLWPLIEDKTEDLGHPDACVWDENGKLSPQKEAFLYEHRYRKWIMLPNRLEDSGRYYGASTERFAKDHQTVTSNMHLCLLEPPVEWKTVLEGRPAKMTKAELNKLPKPFRYNTIALYCQFSEGPDSPTIEKQIQTAIQDVDVFQRIQDNPEVPFFYHEVKPSALYHRLEKFPLGTPAFLQDVLPVQKEKSQKPKGGKKKNQRPPSDKQPSPAVVTPETETLEIRDVGLSLPAIQTDVEPLETKTNITLPKEDLFFEKEESTEEEACIANAVSKNT